MDLNNSKILEKAADILSELSFKDEDLQKIYSFLAEILKKESRPLGLDVPPLDNIKGDNTPEFVFRKLIEILNDPSKTGKFQEFYSLLLNNTQLLELIQNLAIEKIRENLLKTSP